MTTELLRAAIAVIAIILYAIADAIADAWIFKSVKSKGLFYAVDMLTEPSNVNQKWHFWQAVQQATFITLAAVYAESIQVAAICASLFWLIHDGIVNIVGLDRKFFFVGTTAAIDRLFQRFPTPPLAQAVAKCLILALSILAFIIS